MQPPEIIVDPNVWVSALISPGGTTAGVLRAVVSDEVTAIVTPHLLEELSAVLERDKFRRWVSLADARAFVAALSDKADLRPDAGKPRHSRSTGGTCQVYPPADLRVPACAGTGAGNWGDGKSV